MFVDAAAVTNPAFECRKRCGKEPGLLEQPLGTAIGVASGFQLLADQTIEIVDAPAAPLQLVIEGQHGGQQARPDAERRSGAALRGVLDSEPQKDLTVELGQEPRSARKVRMQPRMELFARD